MQTNQASDDAINIRHIWGAMFISSKKINNLIASMKSLVSAIERTDRALLIIEKDNERLSSELMQARKILTDNEKAMSITRRNVEKLGISYDFISQASESDIEVSKMIIDIKINKDGLKNPSFANDIQRRSALSIVRKFFYNSQKDT